MTIPNNWSQVTISDVTEKFETVDPRKTPNKTFKYVDIGSIDNKSCTIANPSAIRGAKAPSRARRVIRAGDTLFSTVRTYLKNIAIVPAELDGQLTSTGIAVLRPNGAVDSRYLFRWTSADQFVDAVSLSQDGTMYPAVSDRDVSEAAIPLPPLPEQRRIVAKIDGLLSSTDRAREQLDCVSRLVEKYKQAILAAAFRGELTHEWRTANACNGSWEKTSLGAVITDIRYGTAKKCSYDGGPVNVLRIPNVQRGRITLDDIKSAKFSRDEVNALQLEEGDILVIRSNGSLDLVGRSAVVQRQAKGMLFAGYLIRLRLDRTLAYPELIQYWLRAPETRAQIESLAKSTSGVNNINSTEIRNLTLLLPSLDEQCELVRRIGASFAWIDGLSSEAANARKLIDHLDQAILTKAFRGELVPQDLRDEPASALLARIGDQRQNAPAPGAARHRSKVK
ncbi:restriction endonuclease subunit S [Bradyrhizobium quebecense]|uniref:Restriction endonuclease subunit S n=1 Tax=Bradyrhizobium quebecense TaxID=2748629 RepID=A0A974AHE3_9BRAD|nr:restriction endonuclease subunit S [Bradyrhizobium quebecense]UGA44066.1 restriction endonuclease subunit S [Bradyrhizobium quebecense]